MGIQAHSRMNLGPKSNALRTAICVCLVVLVLFALIHMAVGHSANTDADHCPLCIVMHSVVPFLVMMVAVLLVRIESATPVSLEIQAIIRFWHSTLFTRPPPISC
jgi:hypothetical protein